jgi:glycosyltransferase involved in cell wall biosynthesis
LNNLREAVPECAEPTISVVVPAYNEEATLAHVIRKLLEVAPVDEVIIVDDGSRDATYSIATDLARAHSALRILKQERNAGKTAALRVGIAATTGDIVIIQDADTEYDPTELHNVVEPIVRGVADVVFGSRFLVRKATRVLYFYHFLANKFLTFLSNVFTNINLSDVETGYKAFRGDIIRNMIITSTGFGFEIEVTAKVAKLGCAIYEVPISYYGRTYEQGKKITFKDGFAALWYVLKYNLFCGIRQSFRTLPDYKTREQVLKRGVRL